MISQSKAFAQAEMVEAAVDIEKHNLSGNIMEPCSHSFTGTNKKEDGGRNILVF